MENLDAIHAGMAALYDVVWSKSRSLASRMADQIWQEKGWTNEDMDRLAHMHMRTPYESKKQK